MRSASKLLSVVALAWLAGCSSLPSSLSSPFDAIKEKFAPSAVGTSPAPTAAAAAPAGAASGAAGKAPAPIDPAVQSAFDNAGRAMRAARFEDAERGYRAI